MEILPTIPQNSIDLILTDPPYSSPTVHAFGRKVVKRLSDLAIQEYYFTQLKKEFERVLKPNSPILIFCDDIYFAVLTAIFYDWQQTNLIVWNKRKIGMGNPFRRQHELIFYANRGSIELNQEQTSYIPTIIDCAITKEYHGAEKPVSLLTTFISGLTQKGDTVLDPFSGSSSTGVACVKTGRNFIGIELEQEYFDISSKRLTNEFSAPSLFSF